MKRLACLLLLWALPLILAGCTDMPDNPLMATDIFTGGSGGVPAAKRTPVPGLSPAQRKAAADGDMQATEQGRIDQQQAAQLTEQAQRAGYTATAFVIEVAESIPVQTAGAELAQVIAEQAHLQATQLWEGATATVGAQERQVAFEQQQRMERAVEARDRAADEAKRAQDMHIFWLVILIVLAAVALVLVGSLIWGLIDNMLKVNAAQAFKIQAEADRLGVQYTDQHTLAKNELGVWEIVGPRPVGVEPTVPAAQMASVQSGAQMGQLTIYVRRAIAAVGPDAGYFPSVKEMKERSDKYWGLITDELVERNLLPEKRQGARTALHPGWTLRRLLAEVVRQEKHSGDDLPTEADEVASAAA